MAQEITAPPPSIPQPDPPISPEEYMAQYAHDFYEWSEGRISPMTPVSDRHDALSRYLSFLLEAYLALRPIGRIKEAPFVLRLDAVKARREPDLMLILHDNPGQFTDTAMIGPADVCIEIVSLESTDRDYGTKFSEYETSGVREYWLIDPIRKQTIFRRLNTEGLYQEQRLDGQDNYSTPLLPDLKVHVPSLWQEPLPDIFAIGAGVKEMLGKQLSAIQLTA
jgi:Uma2 family endonuclease